MLIAVLYGYITVHLFNQCMCNTVRDIGTQPVFTSYFGEFYTKNGQLFSFFLMLSKLHQPKGEDYIKIHKELPKCILKVNILQENTLYNIFS